MLEIPKTITLTHEGVKSWRQPLGLISEKDPILHTKLEPFVFDGSDKPTRITNDLIEVMKKFGGIGLAANQIGYKDRVFVMGTGDDIIAYFNPEIITTSENEVTLSEGCLSYMGIFLKISRPERVLASYQDFKGVFHDVAFSGLTARTFLHEMDHLNGIVFTSHVGPLALKFAKDKKEKLQKRAERTKK